MLCNSPKSQVTDSKLHLNSERSYSSSQNTLIAQTGNIDSLPTETLGSIFKHVYMKSRVPPYGFWLNVVLDFEIEDKVDVETIWADENLLNPLLFPKPIHAVCRRWKAIAESLPMFWTRIVAFVDSHPTPLSKIESYIKRSRDLPLDVLIMRRPDTYSEVDPDEYKRCRDVIEILLPHLSRCQTISFDVIGSSSLPSISDDFYGKAPVLKKLLLNCRVDDGVIPGGPSRTPRISNEPFFSPELSDLSVDGRNFVHACLELPSWIKSLHESRPSLDIHTFTPFLPKDSQFTLSDFLRCLEGFSSIPELSLSSIEFHCDDSGPPSNLVIQATAIKLKGLGHQLVSSILQYADTMESLCMSHCPMWSLPYGFSANFLMVDQVDHDENLGAFLSCWSGEDLHIANCPGLDDDRLAAIGEMIDVPMRYMDIYGCSGFSSAGLRYMVKMLNKRVAELHRDHYDEREGIALDNLEIQGHDYAMGPEEERWFRKNGARVFSWNGSRDRRIHESFKLSRRHVD
ncbi:hypothetical protein Hypma_000442 [Hypsizygus marmoreus]|uniref:F-box domain-containing protein n=1 Tax=Hypsizygus marmoreus TaxID=39966 RepID=A0A369JH05_HYPMA|nr:hypothetical protein Hypma_000442 [Hypsizygus marmoreus]